MFCLKNAFSTFAIKMLAKVMAVPYIWRYSFTLKSKEFSFRIRLSISLRKCVAVGGFLSLKFSYV